MGKTMSEQLEINIKKEAFVNVEKKTVVLKIKCTGKYGKFEFLDEGEYEYDLLKEDISKQKDWLFNVEHASREEVIKQYQQLKANLQAIEELGYSLVFQ